MAIEMQDVIGNMADLDGISLSQNPTVLKVLKDHQKNCHAIVTHMYDIYYVQPRNPVEQIAYNEVKRTVRRQGDGAERPLTESVFKSWSAGEEQSNQMTRKQAANDQVDELLEMAISARASDIHINIKTETQIQLRIHGVLIEHAQFSAHEGQAIVAVMFQSYALTSFGQEEAQDGQFYYTSKRGRTYLIRLNKLIMVGGGITCKCRLRDTADVTDLGTAGYSMAQLDLLSEMMSRGQGLLVITGGVNSGKSTSLTALLNSIPDCYSILEISDTVEVRLPHVCHVELPSEGENLEKRIAAVQDSTVRQDSDYLAIGEMRNRATASKAEVMGLQGRFVLSTGHASDPASFYLRMTSTADFGMSVNTVLSPRFMVGLVSQTLVETLCPACALQSPDPLAIARTIFTTPAAYVAHLQHGLGEAATGIRFHRPGGCSECYSTGLSGRTVIAEILPFDAATRAIFRSGNFDQVKAHMAERHLETKHEHALHKVLAGKVDPLLLARRIDPLGATNISTWGQGR